MSYWTRKYLGIARPVMANVHVLSIQFDLAIDGRKWQSNTIEWLIAEYKKKLAESMEGLDAALESKVREYKKHLAKEEE